MNKISSEMIEEIIKLYVDDKKSMKEIATTLGISIWNVHDKLHKEEVEIRPRMTDKCRIMATEANTGRKMSDEEKKRRSINSKHGGIGGKKNLNTGYISIYFPDHPLSKDGYILEHRLVMEALIGRHLKNDEVVHHINGVKSDNRKENLLLMTQSEHKRFHMVERYKKEGGDHK